MFVMFNAIAVLVIAVILTVVFAVMAKKKKGNTAVLVVAICVFLVAGFFAGKRIFDANRVVGTYGGSEYERITIDGVVYVADYSHQYSAKDKDKLMGKAVWEKDESTKDPMYVWSIEGTDEYIYAIWVYDGTIFKKEG